MYFHKFSIIIKLGDCGVIFQKFEKLSWKKFVKTWNYGNWPRFAVKFRPNNIYSPCGFQVNRNIWQKVSVDDFNISSIKNFDTARKHRVDNAELGVISRIYWRGSIIH